MKRLDHTLPTLGGTAPEGGWRGGIRAKGPEDTLKTPEVRMTRNENSGGAPLPVEVGLLAILCMN